MLPRAALATVLVLAVTVAAALLPARARAAVPSLYLVQNSGWMEPFFIDPASPLKPLLKSLVDASNTGHTIVASFNQDGQVPGRRSPEVVFDDAYGPATTGAAIDMLSLAVRPGGRLADADFEGALTRSIEVLLGNKTGIIWILTNNKNSRNNDPRVDANTRRFAEFVRGSNSLPLAVAYPVRMSVTGRQYTERGLIIYAMAYGDEAEQELAAVVKRAEMRALFTDPPFKLKHLDEASLAFTATAGQTPVEASSEADGSLIVRGVPATAGPVRILGSFRSEYYPQMIVSAEVGLVWKSLDGVHDPGALAASVEPSTLTRLASGAQERNVTLVLNVPDTKRPPGIAGLFAESTVVNGVLELRLSRMSMALGDEFLSKMNDISALDQLPDVFSEYQRVTQAMALLPVMLIVHFSPLPLIGSISLATLVFLLLVLGLLLLFRARRYLIPVDGRNRAFVLRPFCSTTITLANNRKLRVTGRLLGQHGTQITESPRKQEQ